MARPRKHRRVCSLPENNRFIPFRGNNFKPDVPVKSITMTVDEYETIRLIDFEGFNQEECSETMDIARTTVQGIYSKARKKLAIALVEGMELIIEGGQYQLCDETLDNCGRGCQRQRRGMGYGRMEKGQGKGFYHRRQGNDNGNDL